MPNGLSIASYDTLSTVDWPDKLVSVAFHQGCPWNCDFCFNTALIPTGTPGQVSEDEIIHHLSKRKNILDGIVFSGGDPLRQSVALVPFMQRIKELNPDFSIGVHTEGAYPQGIVRVLPYVDWFGLDFKAMPDDYDSVTQTNNSFKQAELSLDLLISSDTDFEVRTTIYKGSPQGNRIYDIAEYLYHRGVYDRWHIQIAHGDYPEWTDKLPAGVDIRR